MTEHEVLTWQSYGEAARHLSHRISDSGFGPDIVLGIARGGLVLASSLAYGLDCKNLFSINVEFYTGEGTTLLADFVWRETDRWIDFPWSTDL